MWDPIYNNHHILDSNDQSMSDILIRTWSSFIKTGIPEVPDDGVIWTPATPENKEYLVLNNTSKMELSVDYQTKMEFWKQLFPC